MGYQGTDAAPDSNGFTVPTVHSVEDTGLSLSFLSDLVLKLLYYRGRGVSGFDVSEEIKLPFTGIIEPVMDFLKR